MDDLTPENRRARRAHDPGDRRRPPRGRAWAGLTAVMLALTAAVTLNPSREASADGTPNITLDKSAPARVLFGADSAVTLTAANPGGNPYAYNLSFRDVLPAGVSYVAGSAPVAPTILANQPAAGQTTLLFENVSDLSPGSSYTLGYQVRHSTSTLSVGQSYTNTAGAYVNSDPRYVPDFNATTGAPIGPSATSYTGYATDAASTLITAIEIDKTEPNTEGEILRGVHDHQTVYTLTVRNNHVNPTNAVQVDDWLPANLEFLGCGTGDNTTDAPTNPGSAQEYVGAGALNPGNAPAAPGCVAPSLVETVSTDPDGAGPLPTAVYTHVRWTGLGNLAASGTTTLRYVAGIPVRANTLDWNGAAVGLGTAPATSGAQGSNLNNNGGAESADEDLVRNYAVGSGTYNGTTATSDDVYLDRTAEDLSVHKSVSDAVINQGDVETWSLLIEASEYRYVDNVRVTDTVPDGLCPLSSTNLEGTGECAPTGDLPSVPYTTATENADGTWTVTWNSSTAPALARMQPSSAVTITFPTKSRANYQQNGNDATPVLSQDSWTNTVDVAGRDFRICVNGDPDCTGGQPKIAGDEIDDIDDVDTSSASQTALSPSIDKRVAQPGVVPIDCATATYIVGVGQSFGPGDRVCWRLRADFPANLDTGTVEVQDFIPPGTTYETGSAAATGNNTIPSTFDGSAAADGKLSWDLGTVDSGTRVFEVIFSTLNTSASAGVSFDIKSNLMKLVYQNTPGTSFPLRDSADFQWSEAELTLLKGVRDVDNSPGGGNPANTDGVTVRDSQVVTYRVDVDNGGSRQANSIEVWDVLPTQVTCANIAAISNGGSCNAGQNRIEWTGLTVAGKNLQADPAPRLTLTYDLTIPAGIAPARTLNNTAGVRQYRSDTNLGGTFLYIPTSNIDAAVAGSLGSPNTGAASNASSVVTPSVTFTKTRTTEVTASGNTASDAAIGEEITYTVTYTVPHGTTVYGTPTVTDPLGTRMTYVAASAAATLNGGALPGGFTLAEAANTVTLTFPASYANATASGDDVFAITFRAQVDDDYPANNRLTGQTIGNTATAAWQTETGANQSSNASVNTTVVEPVLTLSKNENDTDDVLDSGQIVRYTVTPTNSSGTRISTAYDLTVTDVVPAGLTPVDSGGLPVPDLGAVHPSGGVWSAGSRTITWPIASLAPGANTALAYDVRVDNPVIASSPLVNTANVTGTSLPDPQDDEGERTSASAGSPPGYAAAANDTVTVARPTITKDVAPTSATVGDDLVYTITAVIPAGIQLPDATVIDQLPDGVDYDATTSATCTAGCPPNITVTTLPPTANADGSTTLGWFLGDVAGAGASRTVTIVYTAHVDDRREPEATNITAGATLVNSANLYWNLTDTIGGTPGAVPSPGAFTGSAVADTATVTVVEPTLAIDKDVSGDVDDDDLRETQPGDSYTYTLRVQNTGTAPAYDVRVTDQPDTELLNVVPVTGAGFVTDGWTVGDPDMVWQIPGPIAPGGTVTLTYTADLAAAGTLTDGQTVDNSADVPSYWGVPSAERLSNGFDYREYDDVTPDTVRLTVDLPAVTIAKTTGGGGFPESADAEIGQSFPWRVVVTNTSTTAVANDVDITDVLPPNWRYVTGTATLAPGGAAAPTVTSNAAGDILTWTNAGDIAPGGTITLTFSARPIVAAATTPGTGVGNPHVNRASATARDSSGSSSSSAGPYATGNDTAQAVLRVPVLTIAKTPDSGAAVAGSPSQFQIVVANTGDGTARNVVVTDTFPAGITYTAGDATGPAGFSEVGVSAGPAPGETTVDWEITSIGPGGSATIVVPVDVDAPQPNGTVLTNQAAVAADEAPTPVDDTGSLVVGSAPVWAAASSKTAVPASGSTVNPDDTVQYTLHYENTGNENATNVVVVDDIPANTSFVSGSASSTPSVTVAYRVGGVYQGSEPPDPADVQGLRFTVGAVAIGQSGDLRFTVRVDTPLPDGTVITNQGSLTSTQTPAPTVLGPVTHTVDSAPVLGLAKSASDSTLVMNTEGDTLKYSFVMANTGDENATNVVVTDGPPAGTELVEIVAGNATVTCSVDPGPAYTYGACPTGLATVTKVRWTFAQVTTTATQAMSFTVRLPRPFADQSVVTNRADFTSTQTPPGQSNRVDVTVDTAPVLTLDKTSSPAGTVSPGEAVSYTLTFGNTGSDTARNVVLTDMVPQGTSYVAGSADAGAEFLVGGAWQAAEPADPAAVGGVRWPLATLAVNGTATRRFTVRVATVIAPGEPITNLASVDADDTDPVEDAVANPVDTASSIALEKDVLSTAATAGGTLTYTLTVTAGGTANATDVRITDPLPKGLTFVAASDGGTLTDGQVVWSIGTMAPGSSRTVTVVAKVAASAAGGSAITNTATAGTSTPGVSEVTDSARLAAPPKKAPLLAVTKTGPAGLAAGAAGVWRIKVTNTGTGDATQLVLVDRMPPGFSVVRGSKGMAMRAGTARWDIGTLKPGKSRTVTITLRASGSARGAQTNAAVARASNATQATATAVTRVRGVTRGGTPAVTG